VTEELRDYLRALEARGIATFPAMPNKKPFEAWKGVAGESPGERLARWERYAGRAYLCAAIPGERHVVLDVDDSAAFERACAAPVAFDGPQVLTPGGGFHVWAGRNGEGYASAAWGEVRTSDPGALHYCILPAPGAAVARYEKNGQRVEGRYSWAPGTTPLHEWEGALPALPAVAVRAASDGASGARRTHAPLGRGVAGPAPGADHKARRAALERLMGGVDEGERNDAAARLTGFFLSICPPAVPVPTRNAGAWAQLQEWNARNRPPLPLDELRKVFESIVRKHDAEADADKAPADVLGEVSAELGVRIDRAELTTGANRKLLLTGGPEGRTEALTMLQVTQWYAARGKLAALAGRLPKPLKGAEWLRLADRLLAVADRLDAGPEATERGELGEWLRSYAEAAVCGPGDESVMADDPRRDGDGNLLVNAAALRRYVRARFDVRLDGKEFAERLRACGCEPVGSVAVTLAAGGRAVRRFWRVPSDLLDPYARERKTPLEN